MTFSTARTPRVVAITNEAPYWTEADKRDADETWTLLLDGLRAEGYTFRACKFFDDLGCLDGLDPHDWLVWNFGEEWKGKPWSDADVVDEIERRGLAYTGSPADVLRRTQNRIEVKERLRAAGLPTLPALVVRDPAGTADWTIYPAIVKGANQHASVGITRESVVFTAAEAADRVRYFRECHDDDALIEPFLDTREFQVAVWGNDEPEALPPTEIVYSTFSDMRDRLHTQQWKIDRSSRGFREIAMQCPAPLDRPDWLRRLQEIAVAAYRLLGLRDYARFDLRMSGDEPQILDVNSNPELDPTSVVLAGARACGLTYGQMASRIIALAAARMPRRS